MSDLALALLAASVAFVAYTYVGYPAVLYLLARRRPRPRPAAVADDALPTVSICLPVYNEAAQIAATLESLLALDYPPGRRQILVVSDASTDGTDDIVARFAGRGVELLRTPGRLGKTGAENAARGHLRGEVIINTDASIRIDPAAPRALVAHLADPSIGVVSGRDVSDGAHGGHPNAGESRYVDYEMWIRDLESRVSGIVGASGCLYAIRKHLHMNLVPEALSRDFAAALNAREHGFRAVSAAEAFCVVPRTSSLRREYRRKVRTMTRGMETLYFKRHLLSPLRHGLFAWMLWSHKVCRWLAPWALATGVVAGAALPLGTPWRLLLLGLFAVAATTTLYAWLEPRGRPLPRAVSVPAFLLLGNVAAMSALVKALRGELNPIWEPTRRPAPGGVPGEAAP